MTHSLEQHERYREQSGPVSGAPPFLTPPEIAKLLRVTPQKVITWIRRGELEAVNVSDRVRPRYRVSRESLNEFLERRKVRPPPPSPPRRRRPPEGGPIDPVLGEQLLKKERAVKLGGKYYRVWEGVILFY
jgi:excisionase family DNA binding protein